MPAPHLDSFEERARALLDAYTLGTPEAMERHYALTWHRRAWRAMREYVQLEIGRRPQHPGDDVPLDIDDARLHVALESGFRSWEDLRHTVTSWPADRVMASSPVRVQVREPATVSAAQNRQEEQTRVILETRDWEEVLALLAANPSAILDANGQMTDAMLARLADIEQLEHVRLAGSHAVSDEGVRYLARLPRLRSLDLSSTGVTDDGLAVLRDLPQLELLSLVMTRVTDDGLAAAASCRMLRRLNLMWTHTGDGTIRALAGLPHLAHIISGNNITDDGLAALHGLPAFAMAPDGTDAALTPELVLRGPFGNAGLARMRGLDGLMRLALNDCSVTADGITALAALPRLMALSCDPDDTWMEPIANLPALRELGAQDTVAGDAGFVALSRSTTLERFWGRRCHNLRDRGFLALSRMPALRNLAASCLNVSDDAIAALPDFPALRELMPMDIPDHGYRHIGRCTELKVLTLMYCRDTTDAATEHITGLPHLRRYFNSYTTITDRTPALLATMDTLEEITLSVCNHLTNAGIAHLARLPRLRQLEASGLHLTADAAKAFRPDVVVRVAA